jgi:hypothetical protein
MLSQNLRSNKCGTGTINQPFPKSQNTSLASTHSHHATLMAS